MTFRAIEVALFLALALRPSGAEVPSLEPQATATARAPAASAVVSALRLVRTAVERNDFAGFEQALAAARKAVAAHPPEGEQRAAVEVLAVYADLDRIWRWTNESPTGAFFDASSDGGAILATLSLADKTMTLNGRILYPISESRNFLARMAARRLASLQEKAMSPPPLGNPLRAMTGSATGTPSPALVSSKSTSAQTVPSPIAPPSSTTMTSTTTTTPVTATHTQATASPQPSAATRQAASKPGTIASAPRSTNNQTIRLIIAGLAILIALGALIAFFRT
jgi:hypothetical protein